MGNIFAGSEILEIGIQIERNGKDFYETLAAQTKSPKAKDIFTYLAGEEAKHIQAFQGILGSLEKYEPQGLDSDEYYAYMNALASESVFTQKDKGKELAKRVKSDKEAIEMGIAAEKDSIVFYEGIKKVVPEYDHKAIDAVITQEQGHLRELLDLKSGV
jgi:rubrerythrin